MALVLYLQAVGTRCVIGHRHVPLLYSGDALDTALLLANKLLLSLALLLC